MIKINIKDLLFINKFKGNDAARYYFNGVFFRNGGEIVATRGYMLGKMANSFSGELKRDFILDIDKDTQKFLKDNEKKCYVDLEFCENGIAVELKIGDLNHFARIIDHDFPPYDHLFSNIKNEALKDLSLNPDLLKKFAGGGGLKRVVMEFSGIGRQILIKNPNFGERFTGLLMPMRL